MNLTIFPSGPLRGEIHLEGDKSLSHRAALFSALAEGTSRFENFLLAGVTQVMLDALTELGVSWNIDGSVLTVEGLGLQGLKPPRQRIDCGSSATTLRLLAGAVAASGVPAVLDGSEGLRKRPMERIVSPLSAMGVPISASPSGTAPLHLSARRFGERLQGVKWQLPVASAQVKTCLLLAGLAADSPTTLIEPGPSRDHTERMLRAMGVSIRVEAGPNDMPHGSTLTMMPPDKPLQPLQMSLPGDFSSAAFLIVAALITPGSEVLVREVGLNPTRSGLLDALKAMGAIIEIEHLGERCGEPAANLYVRHSALSATRVSGPLVVRMIDEFPAFAVAAAFAAGTTEVSEASELRHKESDRIARLCGELGRIGIEVEETEDGFVIHGGKKVIGGAISHHGDHRLAMSLAVMGLAADGAVTVAGQEIISQSYPNFAHDLKSLGAEIELR
jgi:3-phosphoshikimate 1-carboxyvinyltransferase